MVAAASLSFGFGKRFDNYIAHTGHSGGEISIHKIRVIVVGKIRFSPPFGRPLIAHFRVRENEQRTKMVCDTKRSYLAFTVYYQHDGYALHSTG